MNRDLQWIYALQNGQRSVLGEIYLKYKDSFLNFATRYPIPVDDVMDIYQDCIIVLYENIKQGKLTELKSSIKTYLFAIGKYKIFAHLKVQAINTPSMEAIDHLEAPLHFFEICTEEERLQQLQRAFHKLGPKCREVLQLFYYDGQKIEDIKNKMSYESKDTVKSQKSRCLKQLKEIVGNHGKG